MRKILYLVIALTFLTGCALSTIRPPKKRVAEPVEKKTLIERVREAVMPEPPRVEKEVEKEEVLPARPEAREKEEVLPSDEDIK